ncbi:MAG: stalk domain-containing protein [bacterium]
MEKACRREIVILIMACTFLFAVGSIVGLTAVKAGDTPISLYIVSPKDGATLAGDATLINVAYNCRLQPVVSLELYVDDRFYDMYQPSKPGMQGEHEFRWNTLSCSQGVHKLRINAYDAGGNVAVTEIKVNVSAGPVFSVPGSGTGSSLPEDKDEESGRPGDDSSVIPAKPVESEPAVKILEPGADSRVTGMVEIIVSINDMDDFKYMIFYVDGKLKKISNVAPFRYEWNSDRETSGRHKLSVRAYTEAGTVVTDDCRIWVRVEPPVAGADIKPAAETPTSNVNGPETNIPQVTGAKVSAAKSEPADAVKASIDVANPALNVNDGTNITFGMANNRISNPLLPGLKSPTIGAAPASVAQTPVAGPGFKDAIRESYAAKVDAKNPAAEMSYRSIAEAQSSALSVSPIGVPQVTAPSAAARKAAAATVTGSTAKEQTGAEYVVKAGAESVARELGVNPQEMAVTAAQQIVTPVVPQVTASSAAIRKAAAATVTGSTAKEQTGAEYVVKAGAESVARELGVNPQEMAVTAAQQIVTPVVPQMAASSAAVRKAAAATVTGSTAKEQTGAEYVVKAGAGPVRELGVNSQEMAVTAAQQIVAPVVPQVTAPSAAIRKAAAATVTGSTAKEQTGAEYVVKAGAGPVARELGVNPQEMAVTAAQQIVTPVVPQVTAPSAAIRKAAAATVTGSTAKEQTGTEYVVKAGAESVARELGVNPQEMAVASRQTVGPVIPQIGVSSANDISFMGKLFADNAKMTGTASELSVAVSAKTAAAEAIKDDASPGNVEAPSGNIPQVETLSPSAVVAGNVTADSKKQIASGYSVTPEAEPVTITDNQASREILSAPVAWQASIAKALPAKEDTISRRMAEVVAAVKTVASNVLVIRGKVIQQTVAPYVDGGYTMAAAREPMNTLGAIFTWDKETKSVLCDFGMKIRFTIGSNIADVDGRKLVMPKAAKIVNGRLVVPIRFLSELTGVNINCK